METIPELFETRIGCPYCGEYQMILVDTSDSGSEYIEDCQVCCRPIIMTIASDGSDVAVRGEND